MSEFGPKSPVRGRKTEHEVSTAFFTSALLSQCNAPSLNMHDLSRASIQSKLSDAHPVLDIKNDAKSYGNIF